MRFWKYETRIYSVFKNLKKSFRNDHVIVLPVYRVLGGSQKNSLVCARIFDGFRVFGAIRI